MSFKEVNNLRKAGRLDEALNMAEADLQNEQSDWTYSALFWVLRDYCNQHLAQKNNYEAKEVLQRMQNVFNKLNDYDGIAQKTLQSLERKLNPNWDAVNKLSELSKNGQEEYAYKEIVALNNQSSLSEKLHEDFGWIIYRYLKKYYDSCGSLNARKALLTYLQLKTQRPSTLHSQILNVATLISEKYEDFKFLPFLELWDVKTLSKEDFYFSTWNDREIQPLAERIIERCFKFGYGLDEVKDAFCKNPEISVELVHAIYSRFYFFSIYNYYKENDDIQFFSFIDKYVSAIDGLPIKNEYHSRILSLYLGRLPEDKDIDSIQIIIKWGLGNLRSEDWQREKKEEKEYPSLAEKIIKHYFAGLRLTHFEKVDAAFESLLEKACDKYDDDQLDRNLAILMIEKGDKEKALSIYRSLLLNLNRFYIWKELAEATDDINLKISAYCKAIMSEPQDEFLGEIHLALSQLMIETGFISEAKRELQTYAETYQRKGWRLKDKYYFLSSKITNDVAVTKSNLTFYKSHLICAEEFVYSDIEWSTMFVADVFEQKIGEKILKKAKLVSADGLAIAIKYNKLPIHNKHIGKCYDVKVNSKDSKNEIVLIKDSDSHIDNLLSPIICYVDYHNKEKRCYHLVSENGKELLLTHTPVKLNEGAFCRCFEVPEIIEEVHDDFVFLDWDKSFPTKKTRPSKAIFYEIIEKCDALDKFPFNTAVVDSINESKKLFHCVFGRNSDIIIKYDQTTIRPKVGDYVNIRYISKLSKDRKPFKKMLSIEIVDICDKVLRKTGMGSIRMNYNDKGQRFGFVEDYYVPSNLLNGIEEGDIVFVHAVFDGNRWRSYSAEKVGEKQPL